MESEQAVNQACMPQEKFALQLRASNSITTTVAAAAAITAILQQPLLHHCHSRHSPHTAGLTHCNSYAPNTPLTHLSEAWNNTEVASVVPFALLAPSLHPTRTNGEVDFIVKF